MNTEITSGALTAALTPDARRLFGKETLAEKQRPLLAVGLRGEDGKITRLDTDSKKLDIYIGDEIIEYTFDLGVRVFLKPEVSDGKIVWNVKVSGIRGYAVEYIELPSVDFAGALEDNGGDASSGLTMRGCLSPTRASGNRLWSRNIRLTRDIRSSRTSC